KYFPLFGPITSNIYKQSNICWDLVEARILNFFITTLYLQILLYTMNKTEMDVGEIYYNNDRIQGANDAAKDFISKKNLYKIRCWFRKSIEVTSRMVQDNKRKDSTQCSYLENVFAIPFPCFIFTFVKFSVGSISFCLVVNAFSFSFMNLPLTINGMMWIIVETYM
uniref:Uncharacterized protein n=1 Tax=Strongyloides stercoralis TaxID=6248 RepID=A0AAF5CZF0_STRER